MTPASSYRAVAQRGAQARDALPAAPVRDGDGIRLERFEVALAFNLDPPYRHAQDVFWLEVLAEHPRHACAVARSWVLGRAEPLESTGLVRRSTAHPHSVGYDHAGRPLRVAWNIPVCADAPVHSVMRDPASGLRVGFIAHPAAARRWLPVSAAGAFRLLSRKPTSSSEPAALAPLCVRG
jgi:hypothetical protein